LVRESIANRVNIDSVTTTNSAWADMGLACNNLYLNPQNQIVEINGRTHIYGATDAKTANAVLGVQDVICAWASNSSFVGVSELRVVGNQFYNNNVNPTWAGAFVRYYDTAYPGNWSWSTGLNTSIPSANTATYYTQNTAGVFFGSNTDNPIYFVRLNWRIGKN